MITSATATPASVSGSYVLDVQGDAFANGAKLMVAGTEITPTQVSAGELQTTITRTGTTGNGRSQESGSGCDVFGYGDGAVRDAESDGHNSGASAGPGDASGRRHPSIQHVRAGRAAGLPERAVCGVRRRICRRCRHSRLRSVLRRRSRRCACARTGSRTLLTANDQLRQRVALALSEIWVASSYNGYMVTPYANLLVQDAFGNYRQIMQDMTLSPNMGSFLNMLNSSAAPAGQIANENYGRELMQLFTMGPDLLNEDGTLQTDSDGNPIPAYSELQVEAMARALTGWTSANADGSTPSNFIFTPNWNHLMVPVDMRHDSNAKTLLNGVTLPAGQSATAGPEGCAGQCVQPPKRRAVCMPATDPAADGGNPSPAYVSRVAQVFADNGQGVRGDMKAVITAILLDPEARANDTQTADALATTPAIDSGHLREPAIWIVNIARGLNAVSRTPPSECVPFINVANGQLVTIGEPPFGAPTVFNFFPPDYVIPQTTINAPEFALENTGSIIPRLNAVNYLMHNSTSGLAVDFSATGQLGGRACRSGRAGGLPGHDLHAQPDAD